MGTAIAGVTGRVTAIVADPTASGRMFVGTGDGGVWMRANAAALSNRAVFEIPDMLEAILGGVS